MHIIIHKHIKSIHNGRSKRYVSYLLFQFPSTFYAGFVIIYNLESPGSERKENQMNKLETFYDTDIVNLLYEITSPVICFLFCPELVKSVPPQS